MTVVYRINTILHAALDLRVVVVALLGLLLGLGGVAVVVMSVVILVNLATAARRHQIEFPLHTLVDTAMTVLMLVVVFSLAGVLGLAVVVAGTAVAAYRHHRRHAGTPGAATTE